MGLNEKLSAGQVSDGIPNRDIQVDLRAQDPFSSSGGGVLTVGDIVSTGNISLTARQLVFNQRAAADVLLPTGVRVHDAGLDFVAGAYIQIQAQSLVNSGAEMYAMKDLNPANSPGVPMGQAVAFNAWQSLAALLSTGSAPTADHLFFSSPLATSLSNIPLDVAASGSRLVDPTTAIIMNPDKPVGIEINDVPGIDEASRTQLWQMGIYARPLTREERLERLLSAALYDDSARPMNIQSPLATDYRVSAGRLNAQLVRQAIEEYQELFYAQTSTGRQYQGAMIAVELQRVLDGYSLTGAKTLDPMAFGQFVGHNGRMVLAARYIVSLQRLLATIDMLGLTQVEQDGSYELILSEFTQGPHALKFSGKPLMRGQLESLIKAASASQSI